MKHTIRTNAKLTARALAAAAGLTAATVLGAPGTLSETPLFLTNAVQPNILFLVDDSGSMFWEDMLNQGTPSPGDAILSESSTYNPPDGTYGASWDRTFRRLFCPGFNTLAYDPNTTYKPWKGVDSAGNAYGDMTLAAARTNPYNPSSTRDISNNLYWVWNDMDGDGEYDGPGSTDAGAASDPTTDECGDVSSNAGGVLVSGLSAAEQTNYANWFTYYRKREYVVKAALSQLIKGSSSRMGMATLDNGNDNDKDLFTAVKDVDDITTPVNTTAQANKNTLLDNLFKIQPDKGTPLRMSLYEAGQYYKDNFPSWGSSPILSEAQGGACQQNFTVLMSDGYWNGDVPCDTTDPNVWCPAPPNPFEVKNQDDSPTPWAGGTYADTYENTLADVAMYFYKNDLDTNLPDKVPVTSVDPQNLSGNVMHQHMVTFTAAFGVNGTLPAGPTSETGTFSWPQPVKNDPTTIDDMRHAAWNGRGDFLSAKSPQSLVSGLDAALAAISGRVSTASAVAFNSSALSANSQLYLALFNSSRWSGNLQSYALDPQTGDVAVTPTWEAGPALTRRDLQPNGDPRTIYTWNGGGVPFEWSNLTQAQQFDLQTNALGGQDSVAAGLARLHYLRGDRVCESNYDPSNYSGSGQSSTSTCSYTDTASNTTYNTADFRPRDSRLGDIVHSAPVYVGKPSYGWSNSLPGTTPYDTFKLAQQNRLGVIYVGANDGMLHGFSEVDGKELMAYVPSALYSTASGRGLHALTETQYSHNYYVDLTPSVVDAYTKTSSNGTLDWHTVLIGGLRAGGRGLFALDVTNPAYDETTTTAAKKVMWEFTDANDTDLGYTFSTVSIVPMNNGRWAAIFGNGYNDTGSGQAQLFILFLDGGLDGTWMAGTDYMKLSTGVGDTTNRNGLSTPTVIDANGDGVADYIYAGDLQGHMWVFDVSSSSTNSWGSEYKSGNTAQPLFTAPANQQITARPVIVRNPDVGTSNSNYPNTLVLFGTGQYLVSGDNTTTWQEAFYGVWDGGKGGLTQSDLVKQTIGTATLNGVTVRTLSTNPVDYGGGTWKGWYMNLPTSGERVVTHAVTRGDNVYFSTMIPDADPCTFGGTGWQMVADYATGGAPAAPAFDVNGDGLISDLDKINGIAPAGKRTDGLPVTPSFLGNNRYTPNSGTTDGASIPKDTVEDVTGSRTGRLSWEEMQR